MTELNRRHLLQGTSAALAAGMLGTSAAASPIRSARNEKLPIKLSVKFGMVQTKGSITDKFKLLKEIGYDGVELDSPSSLSLVDVLEARDESGLPVHGVVDSIHWQKRLSDPDLAVRAEGVAGLETAIRDSKAYGGSSVLLVPGRVANPENENQEHVWERSIEGIRKVLPLAAELGIHILIENVWNGFCYEHDGPADQSADRLAEYIDAVGTPWVGAYFDIGNHRKYGAPEEWIRTLGPRIVKLDVKDWGKANGWAKIGDGDVNWEAVREALREIGFTGWATAEVGGGAEARLVEIKERMERVFAL